jgi:hypothetical protein
MRNVITFALAVSLFASPGCATLEQVMHDINAAGAESASRLPISAGGDTLIFSGNLASRERLDEHVFQLDPDQRFGVWAHTGYPGGTGAFYITLWEVNPVDSDPQRWQPITYSHQGRRGASEPGVVGAPGFIDLTHRLKGQGHYGIRVTGAQGRYDVIIAPHRVTEVNSLRVTGEFDKVGHDIREFMFRLSPNQRFYVKNRAAYPGGNGHAQITVLHANSVSPLDWRQWGILSYFFHNGQIRFSSAEERSSQLLTAPESGLVVVHVQRAEPFHLGKFDLEIDLQR